MLQLEDAVARILAQVPAVRSESVSLQEAWGRVVAEAVSTTSPVPPFDNSGMDGYAARAEDVRTASPSNPSLLRLIGTVAAGEVFQKRVTSGTCVRIFTGSPLPPGADCVVMQEDTEPAAAASGEILVRASAGPWENVRLQGEDLRAGAMLVSAGESLRTGHLALLSACGVTRLRVGRRPKVGVIATGSELKEPGSPLGPGQIYESNRAGLEVLIRQAGGTPCLYPIVEDVLTATLEELERAASECDLVITVGGASVGELDLVKPALARLHGDLQFWRVAIKPGRPFLFGRVGNALIFGLPGNPVSALVTFLLLVRPALRRYQGAFDPDLPRLKGELAEPLHNDGSRRHFMRVRLSPDGSVRSAGTQASHLLSSFAEANGLVDVPSETTLSAGSTVQVRAWEL